MTQVRHTLPQIISVPLFALVVLSLPSVQQVFIPLQGEMDQMIQESAAKPPPPPVVHHDVVYRRSLLRKYRLDIYEPLSAPQLGTVPGPPPVVVFLHGGSWIHGDKITIRVIDRFVERMRRAGYFVVAVNYTTSVLRGLTGPLQNVESAISWVARHASAYGYDPRNIGLYGVSAGGHLALMAGSTMEMAGSSFAFVFAECAPSDLLALRTGEAFEHSDNMRLFRKSRLEEQSPVRLVSASLPPVLLFHGGADQVVDIRQSERYFDALQSAGGYVEFVRYPDGDHGFLNLPDETWYEQETRALRFFDEQFRLHASDRR